MSALDWIVLGGTLAVIVGWGLWKERKVTSADAYLVGSRDLKWYAIGLSVMATQASAITFLSMPGQAYEDGMGFVQFYFGLPIAMVFLSVVVLPIYYRLRVQTAYEYLEQRFDRKTRQLTALLFLLSRGLAAGISIYAPAIVLSAVFGWPLQLVTLAIGGVVILYTVSGGSKIVSRTQTYQMVVMLGGMVVAAVVIARQLPSEVSLVGATRLAGVLGKMKLVDFQPRLDTRYTFWSGLTGGLFVALAYFGTDQSQVQRYLGGASLTESRLGLMMNGLVKIPMQLLILFVGVLLFVFYALRPPAVVFDKAAWRQASQGASAAQAAALDRDWQAAVAGRRELAEQYLAAIARGEETTRLERGLKERGAEADLVRKRALKLVEAVGAQRAKDADYLFISFVVERFPPGLIGLLVAVILCASMSAVAAALSSLGSTSVVDFYRRSVRPSESDAHYLKAARAFTVFWGVLAVLFAAFASQLDNLIQAVNILGSIFYGPMLGAFLVGFFTKHVRGTPTFVAILVAQAAVLAVFAASNIGFLWYNVIGCGAVVVVALVLQRLLPTPPETQTTA